MAKNQSKANRGKKLERSIELVFDKLNNLPGFLCIRVEVRQARKKTGGFAYCKKQPFDYLVLTPEIVWAFDAKMTSSDKLYLPKPNSIGKSSLIHQLAALKKLARFNCDHRQFYRVGLVVLFQKYQGLPGALRWVDSFDSPVTIESGRAFDWGMFFDGGKQNGCTLLS